jgi:protein-S-isoprenylcysteine O-methyltransferase
VLATCVTVIISGPNEYKPFGIYGTFMSIFHYTEFLGIAMSNPQTLSPDSFILNHSVPYVVAAMASWLEFSLEVYFVPQMKVYRVLWAMGATMCFSGEMLRKISMITASKSFSHLVQFTRTEDHVLITHGVYSLMRHPSYVGWFWWSIGTQIILANPICTLVYTLTSWKFFNDRIHMEEATLLSFFGDDYYKYQQKVPTGLPFIRGYKIEL